MLYSAQLDGKRQEIANDVASLENLPIATLLVDARQDCRFANARARVLFAPLDPVGLGLSAAFDSWIVPPNLAGHDAAAPSVLVHADRRAFLCHSAHLPAGESLLMLTDVSAQIGSAERATRDGLTGLLLRDPLREQLAHRLAEMGPDGSLAVHYIDLDRFKAINDTLGHPIGDALLSKVADRLRRVIKPGDLVARLGGDEFAIMQFGPVGSQEAQTLAERLVDLVARTYVVEGHMLNVGASVGVSLAPANGTDAETLLRHADLALHRAKADGRGIVRMFDASMNARMQARRLLEGDLRRALALRQFTLVFQPLMQLASSRVSGFEALLRWTHPERGPVSPADFIPLSEETGLIVPIGEWVLRTACREAASWPTPATVAVNISPVQFKSGKLAAIVASALANSGLPPARLELEITEGALLDETNMVLSALHEVRSLGVRIAMDDFGTGYSSLSYLRKFPFDKIKIDQSFVRGLGTDADCDAIVRAVASLGASLGMRTTAEGVETDEQLRRIRSEGCTEVQGFLTGRPMLGAQALQLLQEEFEWTSHA